MSPKPDLEHYLKAVSYPEKPMATLVIPVFNMLEWLPTFLKDLSNFRTLLAYEVIFVDNNSTDGSLEYLKKHGARVEKEKRQGVNFARQKGLDMAKGDVVVSMDADSAYPPSFVDEMVLPLYENKGYSMTWATTVGSKKPHSPTLLDRLKLGLKRLIHFFTFDQLSQAKNVRAHALAFRKDSGIYYPPDVQNIAGCDDGLIAVQLIRHGKFCRIDSGLYTAVGTGRRIRSESIWPQT